MRTIDTKAYGSMGRYDVRNKAFSDSGAVAESKITWFLQEY
jgi:hypothetical protein